jgi:16S rRNA processing protein RimM
LVCVAQIGGAHGIRGEVRLRSFTEDPAAVAGYGPLQTEDGTRAFVIEAVRPAKDSLVVRLAGVTDRNEAEKLRGIALYISRERLPALVDEETFYHADLIGLAVVDKNGAALGKVTAIHNFGAGDLLEVQPAAGASVLLPFTDATVPQLDLTGGRIIADPPEGLFSSSPRGEEGGG